MKRYYYCDTINEFLESTSQSILGAIASNSEFADELLQKEAWKKQIEILKVELQGLNGKIFFEYSIPRMGRRIDAVVIINNVVFVIEFKIGEKDFLQSNIDQVWDYSLDLKNFHEPSHQIWIAPILVATASKKYYTTITTAGHSDRVLEPIRINDHLLKDVILKALSFADGERIDSNRWADGRYSPTPTIIEAAISLFRSHSVEDISRSDASAKNLKGTSRCISRIIEEAKTKNEKVICFVTGVPGAGKTLVGLNIATKHLDRKGDESSVFLSGNGPLVAILREALARDRVKRFKEEKKKVNKGDALRAVKSFIQNVHHFRDDCLANPSPPFDHVAIFDEAQRAWNHKQTESFMRRKKNKHGFTFSEPEFLISCLDRHKNWAVVVCLVGGGQEINTGEAGITEWIESLNRSFGHWKVCVSNRLTDSEYAAGRALDILAEHDQVKYLDELHLSVSLRSFRAENVSLLVKSIIDLDLVAARQAFNILKKKYPIVLTRDLGVAKTWLKKMSRGSERYGIVVSSQAQRLKPFAIDVKSPMDPIHWFLNEKDDIRSSYYLEDVATEFDVQGLELDWACVTWDGDFRFSQEGWKTYEFRGNKWQRIVKNERQSYLKNAYRVLLTRARQGMVIVVPNGNSEDSTRMAEYYDPTFEYLKSIGFEVVE